MDLNSGRIAAIVIGSTASLLFVYVFALVCARKLNIHSRIREYVKPESSVKDKSILHNDETVKANMQNAISRSNQIEEIDGRMFPGEELEATMNLREMDSNELIGHELADRNSHISELP